MLGTANKLATARKITLSGAVSGNANFDGSGNVTITTTQANIAVVTGTLAEDAANSRYMKEVTLPSGFTKDNCVIVGVMTQNPSKTEQWATGTVLNSTSYVIGGMPVIVYITNSKLTVMAKNIVLTNGDPAFVANGGPFNFKIVLMKIA